MSDLKEIHFVIREPSAVVAKIRAMSISGKMISPSSKQNYSCRLCRRSILPLGRLLAYGWLTCSGEGCQATPLVELTEILATPYGCAVHTGILSILTRVVETERKMFLLRAPLMEHAEDLANAYVELIRWQKAFDIWERLTHPTKYREGRVTLVPPRRIDEVAVLRSFSGTETLDPTRHCPKDTRMRIRRIYERGEEGFELPF